MDGERIFIAGGTGFVGDALRAALGDRPLRLLVRDIAKSAPLQTPNVELVEGDVTEPLSIEGATRGCDVVVNLVAIIKEHGKSTFDNVIRQGTVNLLMEAQTTKPRRFVQMSALGAQHNPRYPYLDAKWHAEQDVKDFGIPYTIFRPSVIFGPGDEFINKLADLVRTAPVIPVVGSGQSKFQPVSVKDVADAFVAVIDDPAAEGKTYELGGPEVLTYEQMIDIIAHRLGVSKPKVHVPIGLMKLVVNAASPLPAALQPPVTSEQLKMLSLDNCTDHSVTADLIGRQPAALRDNIDYIVTNR
jgi:NADH dehydrogenase